jgi:WD40 repeat protein
VDFYIVDSYSSTANLTFSDIHISKYCKSRPIRQHYGLQSKYVASSPYSFNPSTMIYTPFRQPNCYGKFSRLLAELTTHFFLLNNVLFDAGEAFLSVTSSFDSLIISFNLNLKLPDLYRDCVNHISFESGTCRTNNLAGLLNKKGITVVI